MMKRFLPCALISMLLVGGACQQKATTKKLPDGIAVYPSEKNDQVKLVTLQALSPDIIKVTASASDSIISSKSLMVIDQPAFSEFTIAEDKDKAILSTKNVNAEIMLATGEVVFKDKDGNILLQEQKGGGKYIAKASDDQKAYKIKQIFESPEDEAFYGLGGHQNGQMNYKGEDVELVQHNIADVIPFVYSSKNYGVLWDNYSISHFGDDREYQSLSSLQLFDKDGKEGGLTADYYVGEKIDHTKIENSIGYEYLETPALDNFPKNVAQRGKVIWEGSFSSGVDGAHKFLVYASGYYKIWIDEKLIMDKWRQNWNPWINKFSVDISKGEKHKIKIEWICEGGYMSIKHLDPLPVEEQNKFTLSSDVADNLNYYFIAGKNADDVIHGYRTLTGKAPIVPSWAMGFWQSRERYKNQQELVDVVKEYRKRKLPLDNIVLDWQYWEDPQWGSHEFDRRRFPDPEGMITELHDQLHAHLMISVWPKFNKGTRHYDEMNSNGFLFTRNIEKHRKDWVGTGYESTFYDPFNPEAGKLFWKQIDEKLNRIGIDAWWLDATEPDMHSNLSIDERKLNMSPTALGPGVKYFNAYSLMNSKGVYEGQRNSSPDKRVFILTRSAYAGQQRYGAATWSGDIASRWSDMKDQIATGINFSLSGIPWWTMDIGGFAVESRYANASGTTLDEWRELNARWFQFGAFCPLFRSHGQFPYREIYNIAPEGSEVYASLQYYDKLRYRFMPYLYSLAGHAYFHDYTIMRGLIMDFGADDKVKNIGDQFMLGPSLLVNPVSEFKARSREVYLPSTCGWYDFYSGKFLEGGSVVQADAPLNRVPVFVKEGSIIPAGAQMQYTNEKPQRVVTLYVYTGKDADFELYEDEGLNYNYEKGQCATTPLHYDEASHTLTIGDRSGSYNGMVQERKFEIVWITKENPVALDKAVAMPAVDYHGKTVMISMNK